jgi:hypothetical protein
MQIEMRKPLIPPRPKLWCIPTCFGKYRMECNFGRYANMPKFLFYFILLLLSILLFILSINVYNKKSFISKIFLANKSSQTNGIFNGLIYHQIR